MDERCQRPGCAGKIVDGFCEDCGRPPAGKTLLSPNPVQAPVPQTGRSTASGASSSTSTGVNSSGRTGTARSRSSHGGRGSTRHVLGAGLVNLTPLPSLDPLQSLMVNPVVPERKRFCNNCQAKLNHERGFCPMCGQEYSFLPTLKPGDVVAEQYEVKGAMAYGGLGWIYLGWDKTLSRWVVLKGLLNSKDESSAAVAVAERQFLAAVKHPKIVGVYNFVRRGVEGYIVMEYVGGKSLKTIRQERGPLPAAEAIAYIHGILPAFSYLHQLGLVYCDFKPDNCMLENDDVKLIDMGGVRRADDQEGDIYGTKGYSAPEGSEFPSFASDLYSAARTLAVLIMDFKFQGQYEFSLPPPAEQPLFAQYESLYRFLLRATRKMPDERFQSADEMAEQLLGVLREIAAETSTPRPAESAYFFGDTLLDRGDSEVDFLSSLFRMLPAPKLDTSDPAANAILATAAMTETSRGAALERAIKQFPDSAEAPLRLANSDIDAGSYATADKILAQVQERDPLDWRVSWYHGRLFMAQKKAKQAFDAFDKVYSELPGEPAPKLALALAAEMNGDWKTAIAYYDHVSRVDPGYTSASFGLARCLAHIQDRTGAASAYARVPQTSSAYMQAQIALARMLIRMKPTPPGIPELVEASNAIQGLALEGLTLHRLSSELLLAALEQVEKKAIHPTNNEAVLGIALHGRELRSGAERELRACARYAQTVDERMGYVEQANRVRPLTLI